MRVTTDLLIGDVFRNAERAVPDRLAVDHLQVRRESVFVGIGFGLAMRFARRHEAAALEGGEKHD
jgi:hypothetical protein